MVRLSADKHVHAFGRPYRDDTRVAGSRPWRGILEIKALQGRSHLSISYTTIFCGKVHAISLQIESI